MAAPTVTNNESTTLLVRIAVVHAAAVAVAVAVPLAVILVVLTGSLALVAVALVVAVLAGVAVTAWRVRDLDARLAERFAARRTEPGTYPRLDSIVDSIAMSAGVEPPLMHVIESPSVNALTWGAGDGPAHIAVTTGLIENLDRVELEAVMAHQVTTVNDRPIDAITLGAALFGGFASGALGSRIARLVYATTDPRSIVLSDIEGATATRYPPGMTSALQRVADSPTIVESVPIAFTGLCFASPSPDPGPFALHPPVEDRIDLMREW